MRTHDTPEPTYHHAGVVRTEKVSPHLLRVVLGERSLGGDGLGAWTCTGAPDDALLLVVPDAAGRLIMPDEVTDGDPYENGRWYTVRDHDPARHEVALDVVVHDAGVTTSWAQRAASGDRVGISSARGWYARPPDATWQLLVGDLTAVPAIARIVQESPAHVTTHGYVQVPGAEDAQDLGPDIRWLSDEAGTPPSLADLVRDATFPAGPGYVWMAGEAAATRAARGHLRHERGLGRESYSVVGYWRCDSEAWSRRYERAGIDLVQVYAAGEAAGLDAEQISDEVDRLLDAAGL